MTKDELLKNLGQLVRLQTYQDYKGKAFKKDLRQQRKNIEAIAEGFGIVLYERDICDLFMEMNAHDIDKEYLVNALKLKYLH